MAEGGWCRMAAAYDPLDVEDLLARDLAGNGAAVTPPPVPGDLGAELPFAVVERQGGARVNPVLDSHDVTISVWAGTWAAAMSAANALAGAVCRLPAEPDTSAQWRTADLTGLPFNAPDANHQDIPRVQLTATVTCRCAS